MSDKIPDIWNCGDVGIEMDTFKDAMRKFVNENVYFALKEFIENEEPWIAFDDFTKVELYSSDGEVKSQSVTIAKLLLDDTEGRSNVYWGASEKAQIKRKIEYLQLIIARLEKIHEKSLEFDDPSAVRLSDEQCAEFQKLFEPIDFDGAREC